MFPKQHRASTSDVREAVQKGVTIHSENFSVRFLHSNTPTKISVVVSKKIEQTAVGRNKLKRRIKGALQTKMFPKTGTFIIYAKAGAQNSRPSAIESEIQRIIS